MQGCIDAQKAHLSMDSARIFCSGSYSELRAREIYDNYRCFDKDVLLFPARDLIFYSADIHSSLIVQQRIRVLEKILSGKEEPSSRRWEAVWITCFRWASFRKIS